MDVHGNSSVLGHVYNIRRKLCLWMVFSPDEHEWAIFVDRKNGRRVESLCEGYANVVIME